MAAGRCFIIVGGWLELVSIWRVSLLGFLYGEWVPSVRFRVTSRKLQHVQTARNYQSISGHSKTTTPILQLTGVFQRPPRPTATKANGATCASQKNFIQLELRNRLYQTKEQNSFLSAATRISFLLSPVPCFSGRSPPCTPPLVQNKYFGRPKDLIRKIGRTKADKGQ